MKEYMFEHFPYKPKTRYWPEPLDIMTHLNKTVHSMALQDAKAEEDTDETNLK